MGAFLSVGLVYTASANGGKNCKKLSSHADVASALKAVVDGDGNAGFSLDMWASVVNRDGTVCVVTFSSDDRGDQWPGNRVISARKANTANAFSLPFLALSTSNLYSAVQPGGSLLGLQEGDPIDTQVAYKSPAKKFGTEDDPMVRKRIGGVNIFGGGLALYNMYGDNM